MRTFIKIFIAFTICMVTAVNVVQGASNRQGAPPGISKTIINAEISTFDNQNILLAANPGAYDYCYFVGKTEYGYPEAIAEKETNAGVNTLYAAYDIRREGDTRICGSQKVTFYTKTTATLPEESTNRCPRKWVW